MKKFIAVLLAALLAFSAVACKKPDVDPKESNPSQESSSAATAFDGEMKDIFEALIAESMVQEMAISDYGTITALLDPEGYGAENLPVDAEAYETWLGLTADEVAQYVDETLAQVPNGSWFAHSVILVKLKDGADVAAVTEKMMMNTSPSRFGCIKAGAISACYAGNYAVLAISDEDTVNAVCKAFEKLSAIGATRLDRENDWNNGGFFGGLME